MLAHEYSIALPAYRAVYIDIAKVASSSIKTYIAAVLELDNLSGNPHEIVFSKPSQLASTGAQLFPQQYSFTFVRNPWDRLVSCYRDKICGEVGGFTQLADNGVAHCLAGFPEFQAAMSFTDFVQAIASITDVRADEHFRSQADYVTNAEGSLAVDFVGRYETLAEDLDQVARHLRLPDNIVLPRLQAAPAASYIDYYTPATRDLVAGRYARDIELFAFRFD